MYIVLILFNFNISVFPPFSLPRCHHVTKKTAIGVAKQSCCSSRQCKTCYFTDTACFMLVLTCVTCTFSFFVRVVHKPFVVIWCGIAAVKGRVGWRRGCELDSAKFVAGPACTGELYGYPDRSQGMFYWFMYCGKQYLSLLKMLLSFCDAVAISNLQASGHCVMLLCAILIWSLFFKPKGCRGCPVYPDKGSEESTNTKSRLVWIHL